MSKILIIDDEVDLVTLLEEELQAKGHEVLAAYDGQTGIALSKMQPDLIILDIMMPGRDGFDVCRAIRDDVLCPVIFLSAKQAEADKVRGLTIGADDYITKPFGLRELMARSEVPVYQRRGQTFEAVFRKPEHLHKGTGGHRRWKERAPYETGV
ncbi:response regulator [Extibacter muris]|uniref:response regulator transcription factor n=1 Tax=Extibacter muris TaxID=1796622 RepID=UPI002ECFE0F7